MTNKEHIKEGMMSDNILTINEICDFLKVSRGTVSRWVKGRRLQSYKVGRLVRVKGQDLRRFVEARPYRKMVKGKSLGNK